MFLRVPDALTSLSTPAHKCVLVVRQSLRIRHISGICSVWIQRPQSRYWGIVAGYAQLLRLLHVIGLRTPSTIASPVAENCVPWTYNRRSNFFITQTAFMWPEWWRIMLHEVGIRTASAQCLTAPGCESHPARADTAIPTSMPHWIIFS